MTTEFKMVPLKEIRPDPNQPRKTRNAKKLDELKDSISKHGVLQPILLRPDGKGFIVVFGERRFTAAGLAGLKEVPARVQEMTDDEAFEIQIIENLDREDIHPLEEAEAYFSYKQKKNISLKELSLKFSKTEEYIAHRLSFNNLIADMKEDFAGGKMLIGHALLFARLTEADQKWAAKNLIDKYGPNSGSYKSLKECESEIASTLVRELGKAPFNIHDEKLVVAAGSCDNCPKRSGHNLLFSDIKEKDRCFDGACFRLKSERNILNKLEAMQTETPEMPVVGSSYQPVTSKAVQKILADSGIKVLKEHNEWTESAKSEKGSVRALCISGEHAGEHIYIKPHAAKTKERTEAPANKDSPAYIDQQIEAQKELVQKSLEETETKIAAAATAKLLDLKPFREPDATPLSNTELAVISFLMSSDIYHPHAKKMQDALKKVKAASKDKAAQEFERVQKAPPALKNFIARAYMMQKIDDDFMGSESAHLILKIAEQFKGVGVARIRKQMMADHEKLAENAAAKIKELRDKKNELAALPGKKTKTTA